MKVVVAAALAASIVAGCAGSVSAPSASAATAITVFGAASLKTALDTVKTAYETAHPGTALTISTDSSATLEMQIEQGAPADVFLSADSTNPKKLVDKGLASGAAVDFAGNSLTIIVPSSNPADIRTPADLADEGVQIIAAGDEVPITKYAGQLVANLATQPDYPDDFATRYAANVASKEDNVAAVVAKIELGEGDAAIVYLTDAKRSTKVTTIAAPDEANVSATYAGVVVKASKSTDAATTFLSWLAGPEGQAILATFGFLPPT